MNLRMDRYQQRFTLSVVLFAAALFITQFV
jgi:hypothetical protein